MCGIFGILLKPDASISLNSTKAVIQTLYKLSETRGKESSGFLGYLPELGEAWTLKAAIRASDLLESREFKVFNSDTLPKAFSKDGTKPTQPIALLAHSRLVTNGAAERNENNQPVTSGATSVIHNGIIVNVDELWEEHKELSRTAEVDTEIIAAIISAAVDKGASLPEACRSVYASIKGAASIAFVNEKSNTIVLATNTGDIYYSATDDLLIFASEKFILSKALEFLKSEGAVTAAAEPLWLTPGSAVAIGLNALDVQPFSLKGPFQNNMAQALGNRSISHHHHAVATQASPSVMMRAADHSLLKYDEKRIGSLLRCTKCVLPETFPYINFDSQGVCNYCLSYKPRYKGMDAQKTKATFIKSLESYRRAGVEPDTIVAFSGGRDSSYGLHLIKKEFGLRPTTFTYDWGMVTDLARRNIARICGELGVQNILVSADIKEKRDNIRKNVAAWLKQPDLGMVPLFMAGDKHFFRVVNQLKKQTGIALDLWSANPLENTDFKSGFCNVAPDFEKKRVDFLSYGRQLKMIGYYGSRFLKNPGYLNSSLIDTAGAYFSYYIEPRKDFFFIFDHFPWEENEVNQTLLGEYDWELAPDTKSTWRIGDGTAPFYNYIYMTARGFSEFDTFRSNQIREGMMTREAALESIIVENRPRGMAIEWYLNTIGLDFNDSIRVINGLDTMRLHSAAA